MKLYIDTRHRESDSASSSDFTIELNETIELPPRCKVRVWNLCVPYSWYTVEEGVNHLLYISEKDASNNLVYRSITLPAGQYDGPKLATAICEGFNVYSIYTSQSTPSPYTVNYSDQRGTITIGVTLGVQFTLYGDLALRQMSTWPFSGGGSALQPKSFNRNLRIQGSQTYNVATPFVSEFVDLMTQKALYLTSTSLGNLSNRGPLPGQRDVLSMLPVASSYGYLIVSDGYENWQDTDCSGQLIKRLSFQLRDATGSIVPLHGLDFCFVLAFDVA